MVCPRSITPRTTASVIDVLPEQVDGEAVAQRVRADALADASALGGLLNRAMQLPGGDRIGVAAPGEPPAVGKPGTAPLGLAPPHPQKLQQLLGERGITVIASLVPLDADQHAHAVDIINLDVNALTPFSC